MLPSIVEAEYVHGFVIHLKRFQLHPELHTLVWPNAAEFTPEFLYEKTNVKV